MAPGAGKTSQALEELVEQELRAPAAPAALALAEKIRDRHGDAITAILFYGSCLRKDTHEGVLDFYVIVDSYRAAYGAGRLAILNALLPPNVFYLEAEATLSGEERPTSVRCKYAVVSQQDFDHLVGLGAAHPYIWARFAQPTLRVWARDDEARDHTRQAVARAVCTLVARIHPLLPARGRVQRFSFAFLWQEAFRRTYQTEFRNEASETIRALYDAAPARYDRATALALDVLEEEGQIEAFASMATATEVHSSPTQRFFARARWQVYRPWARTLALLRLLKTATTFGDWLPYVLWKLERHSGVRPELSERQQRHPLVFGWPVIIRLLRQRTLR